MDSREQQPYSPNLVMLGPNSSPINFTPSMMMSPATARFPLFNNNSPLPNSFPNTFTPSMMMSPVTAQFPLFNNNNPLPNSFPNTFTPSMMMSPATTQFPLFNNNNHLPNSFPNNFTPSMMMSPATARFPLFNNNNLLPHSDPYNNNNNTPKPCVVASETFKKKRGRPRKYPPPDSNITLGSASTHMSPSSVKKSRGRGRPLGSKNKKRDALGGSVATNFTPHVLFVEPGEDVGAKIMAFCEQGRRIVTILSATGTISSVTFRHPIEARCVVTHKGHYELISLTGSFQLPENNCGSTRMSELSVSIGSLDGIVMGGRLAGKLTAASRVQVIVGSFIVAGKKSSSNNLEFGPSSTSSQMLTFCASLTPTSPSSQGPSTESSNGNESATLSA